MEHLQHSWKVTPKEAIEIQKKMSHHVELVPLKNQPRVIAGCDISMNLYSTTVFAGFVVMTYPELKIVSHSVVKDEVHFPYVPGLLSFREVPSLLKAWEILQVKPDLVVVDGVGIAHPRRLGIASHLGLMIDVPTIGCAKNILTGVYVQPNSEQGAVSYIYDQKQKGEIIGAAVRTKTNVKPVFISPGHKITLKESVDLILHSLTKYRIPEPTRQAHNYMNEFRRKG